jgi:nicotinate-nucleotide adenylyltransferase
MKIGIFGGTFNPPHIGHLILAEKAVELLKLDKLIFIPAFIPPHKRGENIIPARYRLKMLNIAIKDKKCFEVSDIEIKRGGTSYTIDTLQLLKNKYPASKFFLLLGYDNYIEFYLWKDYEKIFEICTINVFNRNAGDIHNSNDLILLPKNKVRYLNTPLLDISSTEIRKMIRKNNPIDYYTTNEVKKYIETHNLYK